MKVEATYRNQAARNVLNVLNAFSEFAEPVSAAELGATLSMSKNMIQRALTLLEEDGFIIHDTRTHRYHPGPRILTFTHPDDDDGEDIRRICHDYMQRLHELTHESIFFGIIVGWNRVVVDVIEGRGRRVAHSHRGLAVPLHVSKTSRVLLASLSDMEITSYLKDARPLAEYKDLFTAAEFETMDDVWNDIHALRRDGYLLWSNPRQYGGTYVAFPVLDSEGRPHGVISVGAPIERLSEDDLRAMLPPMIGIIGDLNNRTRLLPAAPVSIASYA